MLNAILLSERFYERKNETSHISINYVHMVNKCDDGDYWRIYTKESIKVFLANLWDMMKVFTLGGDSRVN
jgi:hypothetical protein